MDPHAPFRKQVDAERDREWLKRAAERLPRELRSVCDLVEDVVRVPKKRWAVVTERSKDRQRQTIDYFAAITDPQRCAIWGALFPALGAHIEAAWVRAANDPYQIGPFRRPFRAPGLPEVAARSRAWFFTNLIDLLHGLDKDAQWLARWAPHLHGHYTDRAVLGPVLASVLDADGPDAAAVRAVFDDQIHGRDDVGYLDHHVIRALLNSRHRADWQTVERLLLAAQRQEGLRQSILEEIDESTPSAFRHMLGVVIEHDLARFSATVRAFDVWFGMQWAGGSVAVINKALRRVCAYLDDPEARERAVSEGDAEALYFALWTIAFVDAGRAMDLARTLLDDPDRDRRYIAHRAVMMLDLPGSIEVILDRLAAAEEPDDTIRWSLIEYLVRREGSAADERAFRAVVRELEATTPTAEATEPVVWPWNVHKRSRETASVLLLRLGADRPESLLPYLDRMEGHDCLEAICLIAGIGSYYDPQRRGRVNRTRRELSPEALRKIIELTGSPAQAVRTGAFAALETLAISAKEAAHHIGKLHRTASGFRSMAIARLAELPDDRALDCVERLLSDKHAKRRAAGLELAELLVRMERAVDRVRETVEPFRDRFESGELAEQFERIVKGESPDQQADEFFGLIPEGALSEPPEFTDHGTRLETDAARACIAEVADIVLRHAETEVEVIRPDFMGGGKVSCLFCDVRNYALHLHDPGLDPDAVNEAADRLLPMAPMWKRWLADRSASMRDPDGLELVRASILERNWPVDPTLNLPAAYTGDRSDRLRDALHRTLAWLAILTRPSGAGAWLVQRVADGLAGGSFAEQERAWIDLMRAHEREDPDDDERMTDRDIVVSRRLDQLFHKRSQRPSWFTRADRVALAALQFHSLRTVPGATTAPRMDDFGEAFDAGLVNEHDLIYLMLVVVEKPSAWERRTEYLPRLTTRRPDPLIEHRPALADAVRRTRDRLIELERTRGEAMLPGSQAAGNIRFAGGAGVAVRLIAALGKDHLVRGVVWSAKRRADAFSRLIMATAPEPGDTPEAFARLVEEAGITPKRLLELAMFAPQWAGFVEHAAGLPGLEDAVWWIHAHTKSRSLWSLEAIRAIWETRINERTEIELSDLEDGAVDVAWFHRVNDTIGPEGWATLRPHIKYASSTGAHKRAELFAEAIRGEVSETELRQRIDDKRHQDSLRALGLLPLEGDPRAQALARYQLIHEFKRESRNFGSMRQASEGRAVEIALQNLARAAGYRDTRRLEWSMESEAVADLAQGPVEQTEGETTVALSLDAEGEPLLSITKKGKALKAIPVRQRKHPPFIELRSRVSDLRKQRSRMRLSLEEAMCRGGRFTRDELAELCNHPMLRPMLERLVFIGSGALAGYPVERGRALRSHDGSIEPLGRDETIRVAHPIDLLERGDWSAWQRDCFAAERIQPFKQIFREVYPGTDAELDGSHSTRRYAGHQVQPRQATALLKQRQWLFSPEEGVRKVFHDHGIIGEVGFQEHFYTPGEVEDATLEQIAFRKRDLPYQAVPIASLCPRLFSESMRDIDMIVSVAHASGVDPETSASTVEMRAALLRETCTMLGLDNVRVEGSFARIDGELASYTVHLGSANATVSPARALVIVAIHSQHRGRLFLPFADDDPKTAEVISKTLLLARDRQIKDPGILRQIRG